MSHGARRLLSIALVVMATLVTAGGMAAAQDDPYQKIREREYGTADEAFEAIEKQVGEASPGEYASIEKKLIAVVEDPDATLAGKQFACRMLRMVGSENCIPAVSELLTHKKLSHMGRWVLRGMESDAADRVLREALGKTSGDIRIGIIETIGERGAPKALDELSELASSSDEATATAALRAIGKIGTVEAVSVLEETDVPDALMVTLCDAYLNCADQLAKKGQTDRAEKIYQKIFEGDYRTLVRAAAFGQLVELQQAEAIPLVLDMLDSDTPELKQAATQAVQDIKGEKATRRFARELPDLKPAAQALLLGVLAARGETDGLTPVVNNLADSDNDAVRIAAIRALVPLGNAGSVDVVADSLSAGGEVGRAARDTLLNIQGEGVTRALIQEAKKGSAAVRAEVIDILAERDISDAIPTLYAAAKDGNSRVRRAAVQALGTLGGPDDLARLVDMLLDPVAKGDRGVLERSITTIAGRMDDREARTEPVIDALDEADADTKGNLLSILGSLGGKQALSAVRQYVDSGNEDVSKAAVRALSRWPSTAPMSLLARLAKNADDTTTRILALRGYIRMIGEAGGSSETKLDLYQHAMELASRTQEKRMVLAGMAELTGEKALSTVEEYLDDENLSNEAMQAYTSIAASLGGGNPDLARRALERVIEEAKINRTKNQAKEALSKLERFEGRVSVWELAGPYTRNDKGATDLFDIAFAPEQDGEEADWRKISVDANGVVQLDKMLGGSNRVVYLRSVVVSPGAQKARLEVGSDDGVKAWLNGEVVLEANTTRAFSMPQNQADVSLQNGGNVLLLKVTQGGGQWAACARIVDADGRPLDGLKFRVK